MDNQAERPQPSRHTESEQPIKAATKPKLTELIEQKFQEQADRNRLAAIDEARQQVLAKRQAATEAVKLVPKPLAHPPDTSSNVTPQSRDQTPKKIFVPAEAPIPATTNELTQELPAPQALISAAATEKLPPITIHEDDSAAVIEAIATPQVLPEWPTIDQAVEDESLWIQNPAFSDLVTPAGEDSEALGQSFDQPFAAKLQTLLDNDKLASELGRLSHESITTDTVLELLSTQIETLDEETSAVATELYDQLLEILDDITTAQAAGEDVAVIQHSEQLEAICAELLQTLAYDYTPDQLAQIVGILLHANSAEPGLAEQPAEDPWEKMREKLDGHPLLIQLTRRAQDVSSQLRLGSLALLGAL